jgi:hypothetical protein
MLSPSPYIYLRPGEKSLPETKRPTIAKIELSTQDLEKLKRGFESKRMGPWSKETKQRKIVGICSCGAIPEYIVTRYYQGVKKIEKFCPLCGATVKHIDINGRMVK